MNVQQTETTEKKLPAPGRHKYPPFRWNWLMAYLGISFGLLLATSLVLFFVYGNRYAEVGEVPRLSIFLSSFLVIFGGGFLTAVTSPGRTVWEPAVGAAIVATALSFATHDINGALFSWIMPFLFAFIGARFGEFVSAPGAAKNLETGQARL